jgi:hypothetical protein
LCANRGRMRRPSGDIEGRPFWPDLVKLSGVELILNPAWAGQAGVAFHRVGPIQWGTEPTRVGLSRSSTDAAGCRLAAAVLASKRAR